MQQPLKVSHGLATEHLLPAVIQSCIALLCSAFPHRQDRVLRDEQTAIYMWPPHSMLDLGAGRKRRLDSCFCIDLDSPLSSRILLIISVFASRFHVQPFMTPYMEEVEKEETERKLLNP
jgi:hypothetical protein